MSIYRFFLLTLTTLCFAAPVMAAERLNFRDTVKDTREESVVALLTEKGTLKADMPFQIAAIDLNGDGVDEWIVRQETTPDCAPQANCTFAVAGLSEKKPVLLGRIAARKIAVTADKTYGINRLAVYNNAKDDFAFETYVWRPELFAFGP